MLDFNRRSGNGRVYAGARQADLAAWSSLLRLAGVMAEAGTGRAEAWGELRGNRIVLVTADAQLQGVRLRGAELVVRTGGHRRVLRLLQLTDTHLVGDPLGEMRGVRTLETLRTVLRGAAADLEAAYRDRP